MTNKELNIEMARLCKFPVATERGPEYPRVLEQGDAMIFLETDDHLLAGTVVWNPCGDWNQVWNFVLLALERLGLSFLMFARREHPDWAKTVQIWHGPGRLMSFWDGRWDEMCRGVCEAGLEAFEQLKETS